MKVFIFFITGFIVVSFLSGCGEPVTYYYKPGVSLAQAKDDWLDCYDLLIKPGSTAIRFESAIRYEDYARDCMWQNGYRLAAKNRLGPAIRTEQGVAGTQYYWLAGE